MNKSIETWCQVDLYLFSRASVLPVDGISIVRASIHHGPSRRQSRRLGTYLPTSTYLSTGHYSRNRIIMCIGEPKRSLIIKGIFLKGFCSCLLKWVDILCLVLWALVKSPVYL